MSDLLPSPCSISCDHRLCCLAYAQAQGLQQYLELPLFLVYKCKHLVQVKLISKITFEAPQSKYKKQFLNSKPVFIGIIDIICVYICSFGSGAYR